MNKKITSIASSVLMGILALMLISSAFFKLMGSADIVNGLSAAGFGSVIPLLGITELLSVVLFLVPNTRKVGFYLLLSYLGGAAAIELASGMFPIAIVLIALTWVSVFLRNRSMFIQKGEDKVHEAHMAGVRA